MNDSNTPSRLIVIPLDHGRSIRFHEGDVLSDNARLNAEIIACAPEGTLITTPCGPGQPKYALYTGGLWVGSNRRSPSFCTSVGLDKTPVEIRIRTWGEPSDGDYDEAGANPEPIDAFGDRLADIPLILDELECALLRHVRNHPEVYLGHEHLVVARRFHRDMGLHAENGWIKNPGAQRAVTPLLTRIMTNLVMSRPGDLDPEKTITHGRGDHSGDHPGKTFYGVAQLNKALEPIYDHYASIDLEHLYQSPGQTVLIEGY